MNVRRAAELDALGQFMANVADGGASPRIVFFCSASLPITLTNTRACLRSGVTRTSVIVTSPSIRGSFNSPATMMPNSCRISSARVRADVPQSSLSSHRI
jgi:hypothetical protein